jgi:predicted nucleic acid-binding protein
MKSYLVETSAIINYLRQDNQTVEIINSLQGDITSSYLCLAELYEGLNRITNRKGQEEVVQTFFTSLDTIYGIDAQIAQKFGELRAELKREGTIIEDIDLFIAATCMANNLTLITFNYKHFRHVPGLDIYQ